MLEKKISSLIESQFPAIFQEEGADFILFAQKYFEWLEMDENPLGQARSLLSYNDIDTTLDEFLVQYKEKYLKNVQFDTQTNKRLLLKNSLDIHRSKGSQRSFELFFRLVYGTDCEVYFPEKDVFRTSHNVWNKARFIEIQIGSNAKSLIGKKVKGLTSQAEAYAEGYVRRRNLVNEFVELLYLTNIDGDFEIGEIVTADYSRKDSPKVLGSLSGIKITTGGTLFETGDPIKIISESSNNASGIVTKIRDKSGAVTFTYVDGGWGYSNTAEVKISNADLFLLDFKTTGNSYINVLDRGLEPVSNVVFNAANGMFEVGANVTTSNGTGYILHVEQLGANGNMLISRNSNSNISTSGVVNTSIVTANIVQSDNIDTIFSSLEKTNVIKIEVATDPTGSVGLLDTIRQGAASGVVFKISGNILYLNRLSGIFQTGIVTNQKNDAQFNVVSISSEIRVEILDGFITLPGNPRISFPGNEGKLDIYTAGQNAMFSVGDIVDSELVRLNDDYLADYEDVALDEMAYGFPANTSGNSSSPLMYILNIANTVIGTIDNITDINPGSLYPTAPAALVIERKTKGFDKRDWIIYVNGSERYWVGENVSQDRTELSQTITLDSNTGVIQYEDFLQGSNKGTIISINGSNVVVRGTEVPFTVGTANTLISGATKNITNVALLNIPSDAIGTITKIETNKLYVSRRQFEDRFIVGLNIIGEDSQATTPVVWVEEDLLTDPIGLNADIDTEVNNQDGAIETIKIITSGYGYKDAETVTIIKDDVNSLPAIGQIIRGPTGSDDGFYQNKSGFLSSSQHLYDSDYYQDFSYEIRTSVPVEIYADVIKKVLHVAGTKMFNKAVLISDGSIETTSDSIIEQV